MYKKLKKIWSLITSSLLASMPFITSTNVVFATENNMGNVTVHINYDKDIEPSEGDIFTLTYSLESDQNNKATINIDASMFTEEDGQLSLPPNTYAILDIVYTGSNQDIIEQGYGCNKTFYCSEKTDGSFTIAIGDEKVKSLSNNYGYDVRIKDANHHENGEAFKEDLLEDYEQNGSNPYTMEEYDQDQENKKNNSNISNDENDNSESKENDNNVENSNTENNNESDDESYSEAPITNQGEAKVENYLEESEKKEEETKEDTKGLMLSKLLLIIIVAIIGFAVIFVLHMKGVV